MEVGSVRKHLLLATVLWMLVPSLVFSQIDLSRLSSNDSSVSEPKEPVEIVVNSTVSEDSSEVELAFEFKMPKDVYVYRAESLFFKIAAEDIKGLGDQKLQMPREVVHSNFDGTKVGVITDGQVVKITRPIQSDDWRLQGYLRYQACNSTTCFTPRTQQFLVSSDPSDSIPHSKPEAANVSSGGSWRALTDQFAVDGKAAGYLGTQEFLSFLDDPGSGGLDLSGKSIWLIIGLVLVGGIALNLTPCVLPMIPVTLAVLGAGAQAGSKARGFGVGVFYGLGMAIAYGILGLVVTVTGSQFGVINSSPVFNIAIAALFIALALAMFDVIHIDFTRYRSGVTATKKRGSVVVALFMGAVAALLAGACVAPVIISVILYSSTLYAKGQMAGLVLPFLLGIGMALPWPFAGAGLSILPKPGKWMNWVKGAFGVIILVVALQYGYTGVKLLRAQSSKPEPTISTDQALQWHSLEQGLSLAREHNKPVLVDFWATWCKNCLAMDATTFKDEKVTERLGEFVLVKYQAENPQDPATKEVLDYYGVVGLPTYVVLLPSK